MNTPASLGSWAYELLTPESTLHRSAAVCADRAAVVDGSLRFTNGELRRRCLQLAGSLPDLAAGRPVAVLASNSNVFLEAYHAPLVRFVAGRHRARAANGGPKDPVAR